MLPMPQIVIDHINNLATKYSEGKDPSSIPEFAYHQPENIIPDDGFTGEEDEDIIIDPPTKLSGDGTGDEIIVDPNPELEERHDEIIPADTIADSIPTSDESPPINDDHIDDEVVEENPNPDIDNNILSANENIVEDIANSSSIEDNPEVEEALQEQLEEAAPNRRYSTRIKKPNLDSRYYYPTLANIGVNKARKLFGDAIAVQSIKEELSQHVEKGTWKLLTPVEVVQIIDQYGDDNISKIDTMIFTKEKFNASGELEKVKSRLVARGDMQDRSLYSFEEISAQVATLTSAMAVAVIAAKEERKVQKDDVAGAYLNAIIKNKIIFIRLGPDVVEILLLLYPEYYIYLQDDGSMIGWLIRALYGCIESAELWYENISNTIVEGCGYTPNPLDRCVFNKMVTHEQDSSECQSTILVYVDDLLITCKSIAEINRVTEVLKKTYKKITTESGPIINYLGMVLDFGYRPGAVHIDMSYYIGNCLDTYDVHGVALTPATMNLFTIDEDSQILDINRKERFHSCVAKLLFCAKRVRYDILTAISFVNCPTVEDESKLLRILQYLNGIPDIGITLEADPGPDIVIHAYIDASFGVHHDGKSHSGIVVSLGKGCIYVRSAKQILVTKSSAEAELVAASDELSQVIWLREFLIGQGYTPKYTYLYQDNKSTIAMINKRKHTSLRTRHIHVRYFFIADRADKGEINIVYCSTENMIADIMTKPLQGSKFRHGRRVVMNF
jgi:hypothetical protein